MANLDRIVNVAISLGTQAITELSFSDMLILGSHTLDPSRVIVITGAGELLDLGLPSTDPLYLAAVAAFSQTPSVNQVYIGRRQVNSTTATVGTAVEDAKYRVSLSWIGEDGALQTRNFTHTATDVDTPTTIATALATLINADATVPLTAAGAAAVLTLTNDVSGTGYGVTASANLALANAASTETVTDALAAVANFPANWYGLVITSRDKDDVMAAAAWTEANKKLFGTASSDSAILNAAATTDIASRLKQSNFFRTFGYFSRNADTQYPEAAIMSNRFTYYPGAETWANVRLAGITSDNLTEGQFLAARNKSFNTFEVFRNFSITQNGQVSAGEWIDIIRFRDALEEGIKVSVASKIITATNGTGKLPYTDAGIAVIGNGIREPLILNVTRGGIAPEELDANGDVIPSFKISLPLSANVPFNDKANRILRDVKFTARLAGAIHVVEIKGTLTYAF